MKPRRSRFLAVLAASVLGLGLPAASPARAEDGDPEAPPPMPEAGPPEGPSPEGAQDFLATVFVGAVDAAPPAWVQPGTRLCYRAKIVPVAEGTDWAPEPAGDWVDLMTRARRADADLWKAATPEVGLTQIDVVQLSAKRAVLSAANYRVPKEGTPPVYTGFAGLLGRPGLAGEYWVDPAALARTADRVSETATIAHGPFTADKRYDALWIRTVTPDGAVTWVYDVVTGMLVMSAHTMHVMKPPAAEGQPATSVHLLNQAVLVGVRSLSVPWAKLPPPPAATTLSTLVYTGTLSPTVPPPTPAPGSPTIGPVQRRVTFTVLERGPGWLKYGTQTVSGEGTPGATTMAGNGVAGPVQLGGLWMPIDALAGLKVGQAIDTDPWTQAATTVTAVEAATATITTSNASFSFAATYDKATGLLSGVQIEEKVSHFKIELHRAP